MRKAIVARIRGLARGSAPAEVGAAAGVRPLGAGAGGAVIIEAGVAKELAAVLAATADQPPQPHDEAHKGVHGGLRSSERGGRQGA
ncbi:MAG: hypothetical protein K1X53_12180 [Candidatus Sumerlaeaceae bacterium]|nr:hypothetical protein [Candidatus Sumerlaeaceae bacterium]